MSDDKKEVKAGDSEHIKVIVIGENYQIVMFKTRFKTPLRKLMKTYCRINDLNLAATRFRYDGEPINEEDTPFSLGMEDGDCIEVFGQMGWR